MLRQRFSGAQWYEAVQDLDVTLIGLGGVGSWLSIFLSRIGCDIAAYEFDKVERHNIGGQLFGLSHINQYKDEAVKTMVYEFSERHIMMEGKYEKDSLTGMVVFSCADDMNVRKQSFTNWCKNVKKWNSNPTHIVPIFIDARMSMEYSEVYFVPPSNIERYKASLFSNNDAPDLACNMKATSHVGAHTACIMVEGFVNHLANCVMKEEIREVPFKVVNETQLILLDVEQ